MNTRRIVLTLATVILSIPNLAHADATLTTLATFSGGNGAQPQYAGLITDNAGNLYGTTESGGAHTFYGTVFELSGNNDQTLTTLLSFNSTNGSNPFAGLTADSAGNWYGTSETGGTNGDGTVFELSGSDHKTLTTLATFNSQGIGAYDPISRLTVDAAGNLYGTTWLGGTNNDGTVFELSGTNHQTRTTLATFNGSSNGKYPYGPLLIDASGNLYGTTQQGGTGNYGTAFELSGSNHQTLTTLAAFNYSNGANPESGLIADNAGNFYGTTAAGGANTYGTVFELSGANHQMMTTLMNFNNTDGSFIAGGLTLDGAGNLFGTTFQGGVNNDGTVYELSGPDHQVFSTLTTFDGTNGSGPETNLMADAAGNLYGTTNGGGGASGDGTVFELTNTGFVVPEPGSFSLLTISGVGLLNRRRRIA